jgi:hypothetical protein
LASTIIISLPIVIAEPTQAASFTVYRDRSNFETALGGIPTITEDFQSFAPTYNGPPTVQIFLRTDNFTWTSTGVIGFDIALASDSPPSPLPPNEKFITSFVGPVVGRQNRTYVINFDKATTAFGIDVFDLETSPLSITTTNTDGTDIEVIVPVATADNQIQFAGFISNSAFTQVTLATNPLAGDGIGFDNVTFAPVPEPLTILGAATAAGFGAFFKRKLSKANQSNKEQE